MVENEIVTKNINGFELDKINETLTAVKYDASIAKFKTTNNWISGVRNQSSIQDFFGGKIEGESREEPFIYSADMPSILNGSNTAPSPPEFLLHTLVGYITTSMMMIA